jgi:hypothetical protein
VLRLLIFLERSTRLPKRLSMRPSLKQITRSRAPSCSISKTWIILTAPGLP